MPCPAWIRAREVEAELAKQIPPYTHSYITERNPPVTLAYMRADGERRRQELERREQQGGNPDDRRRYLYEWSKRTGRKPGIKKGKHHGEATCQKGTREEGTSQEACA